MGNDWLLIGFAAFVLTGTGLAAALAAGERKSLPIAVQAWAAAVALALLAAGGACAVLHLGRPELIFGALAHPSTGIFREFVTTGLTAVVLAAYLVALLRRAEAGTTHMLARAGVLAPCTAAAGLGLYMPWRESNTIALPYAAWCLAGGAFAPILSEVSDEAGPKGRSASAPSSGGAAVYLPRPLSGSRPAPRRGRRSDARGRRRLRSLVPLVCAVSRGRSPAACGFISIAAGAVLLQWTVQCLGLPAWQFFAR
ncbi:MAG: hypothetical protein ACLUHG_01575 [Sutterella wadsworthensis]